MLRAIAGGAAALLMLAACAQLPQGSADTERLRNAIAVDDVAYVQAAIASRKTGVNERIPIPGNMEGAPLITVAARYGALDVARFLVARGADINARTPAGETALMLASYFSAEESGAAGERFERLVRLLVESGSSLENEPHNYTPLAYAAYQGHVRIVRYLIERGARVDADARDGLTYVNTPLMMAAIQGHNDTALWLLRAGANPRVRMYQGSTAAELAQKHNHYGLVPALRCAEALAPGEAFALKCLRR